MARGPSPLLGYNTNIRHHGKVYHVQTEDSGVSRPHILTHLFADGGRIVASRKTEYAEHLEAPDLQEIVKKLMQTQHKAMCIALRDGAYDEDPVPAPIPEAVPASMLDAEALDRAAEARLAESALTHAPVPRRPMSTPLGRMKPAKPKGEKLDEAIRAYLDEGDKPENEA